MPSVASETSALIHRHPQAPRNPSANGREGESPFEMLLDMGIEPPASPKALAATQKEPRKPDAAASQRPASKPAEKSPAQDACKCDDTTSGDTKSADAEPGGATNDDQATQDAAATVAAEEQPAEQTDATLPAEWLAAETEQVAQPQPVTVVQPEAAVLPVAADIAAVTPQADAEADLLAQASAQPAKPAQPEQATPEQPQATPVIDAPEQAADPLQTAEADGGETADAKKPDAKDAAADTSGKQASGGVEGIDGKPQKHSQLGQDGEHEGGDAGNAKDTEDAGLEAKPEARPRHNDLKPEPAAQTQDAAPTARAAADTTQTPSLTPAQIHASATGQAHSASATPVANAMPVTGLAVEIARQALAGKHRFEIRLDPPELGRIDVRLDVDREGNVTSRLLIERADTYELLRRDASTLERALQNAGLKTSDNALEFSLRDQGFAQREEEGDTPRNGAHVIVPDGDDLGATVNPYGRALGLGGGVDIRV